MAFGGNIYPDQCIFSFKPSDMIKKIAPFELTMFFLLALVINFSCSKSSSPKTTNAYAIGSSNNLLAFDISTPGSINSDKAITGLQAGETILAIDIRPANGQLYGLGSTSRLYMIDKSTAVATAVGTTAFTPTFAGANFGFDFNPTVDRIRVVSNTTQNFRINPETGAGVGPADAAINPGSPAISAVAYTNNTAGAATTTLYAIDPSSDKLYIMNPPNNGTLVEVGALGINVDGNNGFDITGTDNKAYALLSVGSATKLYSINLTTGVATPVGDFTGPVKGLALIP